MRGGHHRLREAPRTRSGAWDPDSASAPRPCKIGRGVISDAHGGPLLAPAYDAGVEVGDLPDPGWCWGQTGPLFIACFSLGVKLLCGDHCSSQTTVKRRLGLDAWAETDAVDLGYVRLAVRSRDSRQQGRCRVLELFTPRPAGAGRGRQLGNPGRMMHQIKVQLGEYPSQPPSSRHPGEPNGATLAPSGMMREDLHVRRGLDDTSLS